MSEVEKRARGRPPKAPDPFSGDGAFVAARYAKNPVLFVNEMLGATPDANQIEILNAVLENKKVAVASGHGIGKTCVTAWLILWFMSTRPNPVINVTANTKNQLDTKTWRELAKWLSRAKNKHWFDLTATKLSLKGADETWFAASIPWSEHNAEAFAGTHEEHLMMVFDEASAIPQPIWDNGEGAMTTDGAKWVSFGNPTRNSGPFFECFYGAKRKRWKTLNIDSRSSDHASKTQITEWLEDHGEDSDFFKIRVRGMFPDTSDKQFIPSGVVRDCVEKQIADQGMAPVVIGVDIARFGDDQTVICIRQGRKVHPLIKLQGKDTMSVTGHVLDAIERWNPVLVNVDLGAMGAGVVDRLREQGYKVRGINFGGEAQNKQKYENKRAEMWGEMLDWLVEGASIPDDKELYMDLIGPEKDFTSNHQMKLEKKREMKRRGLASPDCGDALALTFASKIASIHLVVSNRRKKNEFIGSRIAIA